MALLWRDREIAANRLTMRVLHIVGDALKKEHRMKYAQDVDPEHDEALSERVNDVVFHALLDYESKVQQTPASRG